MTSEVPLQNAVKARKKSLLLNRFSATRYLYTHFLEKNEVDVVPLRRKENEERVGWPYCKQPECSALKSVRSETRLRTRVPAYKQERNEFRKRNSP